MINESSFLKQENKEPTLDAVLGKIMTMEEYAGLHHETPYNFSLKSGDKELFYFGAPHVRDPKDSIFYEIKAAFDKADPDLVVIEGMSDSIDRNIINEKAGQSSYEEVIDSAGEAGYALKLGLEKGIEWLSLEPKDKDIYKHLLDQGFSKDEIFSRAVLLVLPQYNRQINKQEFKEYSQSFIEQFKKETNWEGFDYSYERAIQIAELILGKTINFSDEEEASDYIDPTPWSEKKEKQTVLNRIGEASSAFRDKNIVEDIAEALKKYKRLFIVYGASHAVMQESALKELFKSKL
ncbi:MAG: hypothetical protein WC467_00480 [Patescibacteria group bacterium]